MTTSGFTVSAIFATADAAQTGPARIISCNTNPALSCRLFLGCWERVVGGDEPIPAAQLADAVRVGVELVEEGLDGGELVLEGGVGGALDPAADLLEQPLGRVQLRAVRRQGHRRQPGRADGGAEI